MRSLEIWKQHAQRPMRVTGLKLREWQSYVYAPMYASLRLNYLGRSWVVLFIQEKNLDYTSTCVGYTRDGTIG